MTIIKELNALHVNGEEYKFPAGEGDMKYADFSLVEKTGATVTLDLFSYVEPSANFTVNAPSEIKEGQMYILRVVTGATPYTMTLGTGITNPYSESITLVANTVHQFGFLAIDGDLELQPSVTQSGGGTWGTITGTLSDQTDLNTALNGKQDKATSGSSAPAVTPSYIGQQYVDTTNNKMYVAKGTTSSNDWIEVGASGNVIAITQAEYNQLSEAQKNDGTFRIISDAPSESLPFLEVDSTSPQNPTVWIGTAAQKAALQSIDPTILYISTES